jgi:hypothetical protein
MYDYVIGGTHHFPVDRVAAEQSVKLVPSVPLAPQQNRTFLKVAAERWRRDGIDQMLDLGSGLPPRGTSTTTCRRRRSSSPIGMR